MDSTSITYERVKDDANTIKTCSVEMSNIFASFEKSMQTVGTPENFEGLGNESLQEKYNRLKQKFDDYVDLVERFANEFLVASAETRATEESIAKDASQLAN